MESCVWYIFIDIFVCVYVPPEKKGGEREREQGFRNCFPCVECTASGLWVFSRGPLAHKSTAHTPCQSHLMSLYQDIYPF